MKKWVLIVDPSEERRLLILDELVKTGFSESVGVGNPEEAVRKFEELRPEVIIVSIDGLGLLSNVPDEALKAGRIILFRVPESGVIQFDEVEVSVYKRGDLIRGIAQLLEKKIGQNP